jgi:hypothetical protein
VRGSVARSLAAVRKERMAAAKPVAAKQQPQKPSKKPVNKAQRAYLAARSAARSRGGDLRGADAGTRRLASSAAAVVRGMERRRSAAVPKAPADSPRARQQQMQVARAQRAIRNQRAAMAREADGPGSKASRSATVARRAQQIYAGKVDPKAKTKSRLTKTRDPEVLRKRIAKIKDNTARAAAKAAAKEAKAAAKPKPAKSEAAVKTKPPVARKGKTVEQVRKQWDERIAPSFKRRKSAIEKIPNEKERRNKLIALARRERNAGGALLKKLSELQSGTSKPKPTAPKRTRASRPVGTVAKPRGMKPGAIAERRGKRADEPVVIQRASRAPGYRIPKPPLLPRPPLRTKPPLPPRPRPEIGQRIERSIANIADRRMRLSASPNKQWNAQKTQQRAAAYLRAASAFASKKGVSLARALRSGPKNSTKPKRRRSKP